MDNFIPANKCVIGETYYLSGMWYDITTSTPLINRKVKFIGKGTNSNVGLCWSELGGKHHFELIEDVGNCNSGDIIKAYAKTDFLIEPIDNPDILNPEKIKEYLIELY
jgi:hypothetical protein